MQVLRCQRDVVLRAGACYDRSARSRHLAGSDAFGQDSPALSSPNALSCEPSTDWNAIERSEEHTSELQSLMRISYAVFCLKKKKHIHTVTIAIHILLTTHKQQKCR